MNSRPTRNIGFVNITRGELEELVRDPATHFAAVQERNNLRLIIDMALSVCYDGCMGPMRGERVDLPNGWVRSLSLRYEVGTYYHTFAAEYLDGRIHYRWAKGPMCETAAAGNVAIGYNPMSESWENKRSCETISFVEMLSLLGPVTQKICEETPDIHVSE